MSAQGEVWRVSTIEGTFEADLDTLKQWIVEGCVLPTDKVSKGTHNWIEAGRAPMLRAAFNGDVGSSTVVLATTDASAQLPPAQGSAAEPEVTSSTNAASFAPEARVVADLSAALAEAQVCHNHAEVAAKFICRVCAETFCDECPKFIGSSKVPLCPLCGDLCRPIGQEREKFKRQEFRSTAFGFADFGRALCYPWQHKIALLFGALLYGFLLIAGFYGRVVGTVIMLGCISQVINQVAWGRLNLSFLPDFSSFCLWDDLVVPIRSALGVLIVTWGPAIAILFVFVFGVIKGPSAPSLTPHLPQPVRFAPQDTADEPGAKEPNPESAGEQNIKPDQPNPGFPIGQRGAISPGRRHDPTGDMQFVMNVLGMGLVLLPFFLLCVAWAIFYYPMALTVAGYTEQFGSIINPLVGLDTIRRMRGTYFKAFGMVILIQIVGVVVAVIIAIILSPFDMPFVGNLPATFAGGSVTFYFNLVIACILGLSLHKCADRLGINVD
jgi:Protein of unknown function (DUF4013)